MLSWSSRRGNLSDEMGIGGGLDTDIKILLLSGTDRRDGSEPPLVFRGFSVGCVRSHPLPLFESNRNA